MSEFDDMVDDLLAESLRQDPDPVDLFEDELAAKLGLKRHPATSINDWRTQRVKAIDAARTSD